MLACWRRWRRGRLARREMPSEWLALLDRHVTFFRALPEDLRATFLRRLKVFVWEKHFIPAGGMEITDEVRVVIAAAAVRLVLHLDLTYYDRLTEIVVYPHAYRHRDTDGVILGEAHTWGTVVLSWPAVRAGLANPHDGHDTATHEFAHVLDVADGAFDGAPQLRSGEDYRPWAEVMSTHYERLLARRGAVSSVLRDYGGTHPAEFFAVATEAFFEKLGQLDDKTPELYEELRRFYGFDPASDGRDGVPSGAAIGRNGPCPCGSGKRYKR